MDNLIFENVLVLAFALIAHVSCTEVITDGQGHEQGI